MPLTRTYITGATGRLGRAVLERTGAIPLVRKPSGLADEVVTDFSETQLRAVLKDAAAIIHTAGSVDTLDGKAMYEANVGLTRRIATAAPQGTRIIFAGSVSVYGKRPALPVDENTPPRPDSAYARTKYEAERIVASRPHYVIFRIATIYGPQFGDYYRVFSMIENGKMRIIGDGNNHVSFVHVDDVAGAMAAAVKKGSGTYVVSGAPMVQAEIYAVAARALGVEPPSRSVSLLFASLAAAFGGLRYRLTGKRPALTEEHVAILGSDRFFDCTRARKELGFSPRPLEDGIRAMVAEYKNRGNR